MTASPAEPPRSAEPGRAEGRAGADGATARRRLLPFAREGLPFVLAALLVLAAAAAWAAAGGWGGRTVAPALAGAGALFVAYFFRDPERRAPADDVLVVSPADGKVLGVGPADRPSDMRIAIFLSIFDVHVQRAPLAGSVRWRKRDKGSFKAAWREDAGKRNARVSLGMITERGPIVVRQIAGLAARRIVTYPQPGDRLAKGDRIGLIRFGSRVELDVPEGWAVSVRTGDRVRAGETVVAQASAAAAAETGADSKSADGADSESTRGAEAKSADGPDPESIGGAEAKSTSGAEAATPPAP